MCKIFESWKLPSTITENENSELMAEDILTLAHLRPKEVALPIAEDFSRIGKSHKKTLENPGKSWKKSKKANVLEENPYLFGTKYTFNR